MLRGLFTTRLRLVITGTGRSGTGYISELLRASGVPCGHEQVFTCVGRERRPFLLADASWMAAAELPIRWPVLHQVRNPLDVINSLVGIRFFSDRTDSPYRRFARRHETGLIGDEVHDAMVWYVAWNERIEPHATFRYRIEDMDAALVRAIGDAGGLDIDLRRAEEAIASASPTTNSRERAELGWEDLPGGPLLDRLRGVARRYGYEIAPS